MATATSSRRRSGKRAAAEDQSRAAKRGSSAQEGNPPASMPVPAGKPRPARKPSPRKPQPARPPATAAAAKAPGSRRASGGGASRSATSARAKSAGSRSDAGAKKAGTLLTVVSGRGRAAALARKAALSIVRPPIQLSTDVAVPLPVVWREWMRLEFLPEGPHRVGDIERDGDTLSGVTQPGGETWAAEILDERDLESFAWESRTGSDCAGLITFHRLSERLTRMELTLDVVPTGTSELVALATHLAEHRAGTDLRRFKARLEVMSPDLYDDEDPDDSVDDPGPDDAGVDDDDRVQRLLTRAATAAR